MRNAKEPLEGEITNNTRALLRKLLGKQLVEKATYILTPCERYFSYLLNLLSDDYRFMIESVNSNGWWKNVECRTGRNLLSRFVLVPTGPGVRDVVAFLNETIQSILFLGTLGGLGSRMRIGDIYSVSNSVYRERQIDWFVTDGVRGITVETVDCFSDETEEKIAEANARNIEGFDLEIAHLSLESSRHQIPLFASVVVSDLPGRVPFHNVSLEDSLKLHISQENTCRRVLDYLQRTECVGLRGLASSVFSVDE